MAEIHADIGGSSNWECTASFLMSQGKAKRAAGAAAEQGNAMHQLALEIHPHNPKKALELLASSEVIQDHQRPKLIEAIAQVDSYIKPYREDLFSDVYFEKLVPIALGLGKPEFAERCFGTADILAYDDHRGRLLVADLKTGVVRVTAESVQLLLYAAGAYHLMTQEGKVIREIELVIFQFGHEPDSRVISVEEAQELWADLGQRLDRMINGPLEFTPGDACQYCLANGECKESAKYFFGEDLHVNSTEPHLLASQDLANLVANEKGIKDFLTAARTQLVTRIQGGEPLPEGLKFVKSITRRDWTDKAKAIELVSGYGLIDELAPRRLATPTKVLEALPTHEEDFAPLVFKPEGSIQLVSTKDRRKAVDFAADDLSALLEGNDFEFDAD
jgi:hypothetical protein